MNGADMRRERCAHTPWLRAGTPQRDARTLRQGWAPPPPLRNKSPHPHQRTKDTNWMQKRGKTPPLAIIALTPCMRSHASSGSCRDPCSTSSPRFRRRRHSRMSRRLCIVQSEEPLSMMPISECRGRSRRRGWFKTRRRTRNENAEDLHGQPK